MAPTRLQGPDQTKMQRCCRIWSTAARSSRSRLDRVQMRLRGPMSDELIARMAINSLIIGPFTFQQTNRGKIAISMENVLDSYIY